nr:hypothetical protein [Mucilaginibacter sp. E4BP6]
MDDHISFEQILFGSDDFANNPENDGAEPRIPGNST